MLSSHELPTTTAQQGDPRLRGFPLGNPLSWAPPRPGPGGRPRAASPSFVSPGEAGSGRSPAQRSHTQTELHVHAMQPFSYNGCIRVETDLGPRQLSAPFHAHSHFSAFVRCFASGRLRGAQARVFVCHVLDGAQCLTTEGR